MGFNTDRIKANGRSHYDQNKWNNVLVVVIQLVLAYVVSYVSSFVGGLIGGASSVAGVIPSIADGSFEDIESSAAYIGSMSVGYVLTFVITYAINIFTVNIINMGLVTWFHKAINDPKANVGRMFEPFTVKYLDNVLTMFLKNLFITLWSLLFVIPGIIKTYEYYAVEYIKSECPDMAPMKVLDLSKRMMNGHKMDVFILQLSFIGWALLSAITCNLVGIFYAYPYMYASYAFAYEEIKADAIASGRVNAEEFI
ncbi:MAG: DUF975 family protein [Oscillospiraceae bacterium]|nr:DUF975 family protein [Oscillospiraceae bacterium]